MAGRRTCRWMSKETPPGVDEGKGMARQDVAVERRKERGKSHKHGVFMLEMWARVLNGIEAGSDFNFSTVEAARAKCRVSGHRQASRHAPESPNLPY